MPPPVRKKVVLDTETDEPDFRAFDNRFVQDMALFDEIEGLTPPISNASLLDYLQRLAKASKRTKRAVKKIISK